MKALRQLFAILVLARISASLALVLLEGATGLLETAAFMIALAGLAPVTLVVTSMLGIGRAGRGAPRELPGGLARQAPAR